MPDIDLSLDITVCFDTGLHAIKGSLTRFHLFIIKYKFFSGSQLYCVSFAAFPTSGLKIQFYLYYYENSGISFGFHVINIFIPTHINGEFSNKIRKSQIRKFADLIFFRCADLPQKW